MHRTTRSFVIPSLALGAVFAISACGGSSTTSGSTVAGMTSSTSTLAGSSPTPPGTTATGTPATGKHNDADVMFATMMIPHHRQAVQMADLALTRASSPKVKALAAQIKAAQAPEIDQMGGWLAGWGAPVPGGSGMPSMAPSGSMSSGTMGDMKGMSGDGMMSDHDMQALGAASGKAFDIAFLTGMTAHHKGAVAMAATELSQGSNGEAKKLGQAIITSQTLEITQMAELITQAKG